MESSRAAPAGDLSAIPSVNALLERPALVRLAERLGHAAALDAARAALDELRGELAGEGPGPAPAANGAGGPREALAARAEMLAERHARRARRSTLRRVINATGVLVHTNLGRAPLSRAAARAAARAARGYVALEYDLASGGRGSRYVHCEALLRELTGAGGALVVNNNAAALLLAVNTAAAGKAVIVSRGELIEIGGGFRVHEILTRSGARLVEVGATNRTHADDYARALDDLGADAGAILKVHRSNFVQSGFVAEVGAGELVRLVRARGADVPVIHDLGSGCLIDLALDGAPREPTVREAVAEGPAFVTASGDKLLGGPQAGCLVGTGVLLEASQRNPLARALRADKLTLAALEATLSLYRDAETALREIPILRMLTAQPDQLASTAGRLAGLVNAGAANVARVTDGVSAVGGGSFPAAVLPTSLVAIDPGELGATGLALRLRLGEPAVIARVQEERVLLDPRTLPEAALPAVADAVLRALGEK
jgi:L-seryl-tRNA(Ser) seleniumtransferase